MLFSGTRPARARPRGSVWTIPILTDAASSDSAVQEFEVPGHSVLKFRMNVSGGDSGGKLALLSSDRFRSIDGSSQLTHPTSYFNPRTLHLSPYTPLLGLYGNRPSPTMETLSESLVTMNASVLVGLISAGAP